MIVEYMTLSGEVFSVSQPTAKDIEEISKSINGEYQKSGFHGFEDPFGQIFNDEVKPIILEELKSAF